MQVIFLFNIEQEKTGSDIRMKFDINKNIIWIYSMLVVIIFVFLIVLYGYDRVNDTRQQQSAYHVMKWDNYTVHTNIAKTIISGEIRFNDKADNVLVFYTTHQNVEVRADKELIYEYPVNNNNPFSRSPGYCWNYIDLPLHTHALEITLSSPYQSYLKNIPVFYVGNDFSLLSHIVASNIVPFLLCIIMFVIGITLIFYHIVMAKNVKSKGKIFKLGIFSLFLSIWSVNECSLMTLILKNNIVTSYLSFLSLMILPIPFALFVRTFYEDESSVWNSFYKLNVIQIAACMFLQFTGMADLRDTLWSTHIMLVILAFIILFQSYKMLKDGVHSHLVKIHLACICLCVVSLVIDMTNFYTSSSGSVDSNTFGRIGFLAYIVVLGISSTLESASLIKKGQEASAYQKLAYTDQMTGLNNRTCFNIDFEELSKNPDDVTVIAFDLNNLKYTNDTFGHSAGDRYIKNCATIIYEIFNGIGKCYRVGGDEFVALIEHSSAIDMRKYLAMLESSVDASNKENRELRMQIAYGCAVYTPGTDKNLEATYNRADNNMYQDKKAKKDPKNRR